MEQQHSAEGEPQQLAMTVTDVEFAAVDIEAPVRGSSNVDCWSLASLYQTATSKEEESGNATAVRVFGLLSAIANIHFKPEDRSEPYGPHSVTNAHRSIISSDLRGDQSAVIAEFVPTIRNPGLRARLADIAWQYHRKLAAMAQQAIDAYCEAVQLVLDGEAKFVDEDRTASSNDGCDMLRRACQIAHATGWKDPHAPRLRTLLGAVIRDAIDRQDHRGFFNSSEVFLQFGIDDDDAIAANAENFAISKDVDPHWSHDLWELAARAHWQTGNGDERDRCLVGAAESFITIADASEGQGMVAASFIMDAIQALRRLPNTKQRRQALEKRLRHAQASVRDEMGVISTKIGLTEDVKDARRRVAGASLAQALAEFGDMAASPDPETLREHASKQAGENPLSSLMPTTVVDEDGKVVAKSPGFLGAGARDDLVPLGPHALDGAERHDLARLFAGLRLSLAGPTDDLAVERRLVALDDVAVIVETAHEHMNEKSARAGAGCRGCLHNGVSPGIGGCERREHPPGHPSAALLPARLDLSEAQGAREGRGRALPRSLLREVTGEPTPPLKTPLQKA